MISSFQIIVLLLLIVAQDRLVFFLSFELCSSLIRVLTQGFQFLHLRNLCIWISLLLLGSRLLC